jgi:hypothetical protein
MASKPDASKFPIHISIGSHYLCRGELVYTPPPVKLMGDSDWHNNRPLCEQCGTEHIVRFGEEAKWPKQ